MQVLELFGPSSGGKSTLARRLCAYRGSELRFGLVQDRLLERLGLGWLPEGLPRKLLVDAIALVAVLLTWPKAGRYYAFSASQALRGRFQASLWLRLNLVRNAWKGVALRLLAPCLAAPGEVLLLDEGPLQTANYLLVHATSEPDAGALEAFLRVAPLPDAAAYVRCEEEELVRRTERRGHPRVPAGVPGASRAFVRHALAVFDRVAAEPRIAERMVLREVLAHPACTEQRVAS